MCETPNLRSGSNREPWSSELPMLATVPPCSIILFLNSWGKNKVLKIHPTVTAYAVANSKKHRNTNMVNTGANCSTGKTYTHPRMLISVIKATPAKRNDFIKVTSQSFSQYAEIPKRLSQGGWRRWRVSERNGEREKRKTHTHTQIYEKCV